MYPDLNELIDIIRKAAKAQLLPRFDNIAHSKKHDGGIVTEADTEMQDHLEKALVSLMPGSLVLGEEMHSVYQQSLLNGHFEQPENGLWIVDPLDGTRNFAAGIPVFCVSVALLLKGEIRIGVIYDPLRDECFSAVRNQGAWLNGELLSTGKSVLKLKQGVAVIDFKRLHSSLAIQLASHPPYASHRSFGSAALEWCWLAAERFQLYLHGGQQLWDYAAGELILRESGGKSAMISTEQSSQPIQLSKSVIAASNKQLFDLWNDWVITSKNQ